MSVSAQFQSFIRDQDLFHPQDRILLAVSGGRDSMVMVRLFNEAGYRFGIAHCNFMLRGSESDGDEEFCRETAASLAVPFECVRFDTAVYAREKQISIQMAARDLRYQWFEEVRRKGGYKYVATAHHQNDAVETVLLNLTRGTGVSGLHGIRSKRDSLIRPMLGLSGEAIRSFAEENQVLFREDSSNASVKYARNRIRQDVIPVLKLLNPSLEQTFEKNIQRFSELEDLLVQRLDETRAKLFHAKEDGSIEISLMEIQTLRPLKTLIYGLFQPFGFSEFVLDDLIDSWKGQSGKKFSSPTHTIILDRGRLLLTERKTGDWNSVQVRENEDVMFMDKTYTQQIFEAEGYEIKSDPGVLQTDFDLLVFPLRLRNWTIGDFFYPLGLGGRKKVSDFFVDRKVPVSEKGKIPVLENGNGDIIWIGGMRIDERYKIAGGTKKVFIFG